MKLFVGPKVSMTPVWSRGTKVMTEEFGELVDMESGCWAAVLGHSHPKVVEVIHNQVEKLFHTHQFFESEDAGKLVEELCDAAGLSTTGGNYSGTFLSSGGEAVSLAVKLSEVLTGRRKKLCMNITYLGACADLRHPRDPLHWNDLDVTECLKCGNDIACRDCGKFADLDFSEYAAFVFEPGNSGGLVLTPPEKLVAHLTTGVRNAGGLVVVNEVTTGFGRTGKWFGFQHYTCFSEIPGAPDFIALGKGLGNGYPISAVLTNPELALTLEENGFRYVQSHTDDPLGCKVAREVAKVIQEEGLVESSRVTGEYLREGLNAVALKLNASTSKLNAAPTEAQGVRSMSVIEDIRGRGMMNVVMLNRDVLRAASGDVSDAPVESVFEGLLKEGYFVGFSEALGFIHLYAPLILSKEEADGFCEAFERVLSERIQRA